MSFMKSSVNAFIKKTLVFLAETSYHKHIADSIKTFGGIMKEKYISTRGGEKNVSASEGIIKGLAADGGLFVPSFIHDITLSPQALHKKNYSEMAQAVFSLFLDDFSSEQITRCVHEAYGTGKFEAREPVCVRRVDDRWFLELFHGPTCAFKDMALTILPHLMTASMANTGMDKQILILTATSGDTGKAALSGFADVDNISILVYYPKDGVSTIQEKQMLTQEGANTCVVGVSGNFDDTQNGVKKIFGDAELAASLAAENVVLSSANSINIGRLLPQVVYYFYSYDQLVRAGSIELGDPVNFVVPTGNFGDILAGYYAWILGLPVHRFICASNANNILTDFFASGLYDRNRDFYKTMSPSMDILISSNLERLLFDLAGQDGDMVRGLMDSLSSQGSYQVPMDLLGSARSLFWGGYASEDVTADAMSKMYHEHLYLMDPHTAVANAVYDSYLGATGDATPTIILSTASPFKFGHSVYESIFGSIPEGLDDYQVLTALSEKTGVPIPAPLQGLDAKPDRHHKTCTPAEMAGCVTDFAGKDGQPS
jgi:threonine synthase